MLSRYKGFIVFAGVVLLLLLAIYLTRPAPYNLGSYSASLKNLTPDQRRNVCLGARKINNTYVNPGMVFSFNAMVGPRTIERGFVPSKVIFEGDVIESVGGGICLLSSALYNAVIRSNLQVVIRVAHTKIIRSVPAGLDATVWYGLNDLSFKNNTSAKVKVVALCSYDRLNVSIKGNEPDKLPEIIIEKHKMSEKETLVSVYKKVGGSVEKISEDVYMKP
ncbi:MAG: VanW family protein [Cyanobacteriota bacterium]